MPSPSCHSNGEEGELQEYADQVTHAFSEQVRRRKPECLHPATSKPCSSFPPACSAQEDSSSQRDQQDPPSLPPPQSPSSQVTEQKEEESKKEAVDEQ